MILCPLLYVKKLVFRKKKYIFVGNLLLRSFHLFRFMQKALVMSDIYMYTFAMINVRNLSDFNVLFRQIYLKTMLLFIKKTIQTDLPAVFPALNCIFQNKKIKHSCIVIHYNYS